ncbi:hypothetical protein Tco_0015769 [Tanacetum coccineum]
MTGWDNKVRGVEYVINKILGFFKEYLELGPEYLIGLEEGEVSDEGGVTVEEVTESDIDPAAPTTTVNKLILEWEERIKLHQEKEMNFNQWRSKMFNDECSTLVNEGCEVSDEGGFT